MAEKWEDWGYTWHSHDDSSLPKRNLDAFEKAVCWTWGVLIYAPCAALAFSLWLQFLLENFLLVDGKEAEAMAPLLGLIAAVFTPVACALVWRYLDYKKLKLRLNHERLMRQDERNHEIYQQTLKIPGGS